MKIEEIELNNSSLKIRYWLDKDTALKVDQRIQKGLFLFACTNSCINPIVYGLYNIPRRASDKVSNVFRISNFVRLLSYWKIILTYYCKCSTAFVPHNLLWFYLSFIWLILHTHLTRITIISAFPVDRGSYRSYYAKKILW